MKTRDCYIDFLRALGLILLISVHVGAPEWYQPLRSFDVPLMVFISAMCYNSLRGGYLAYFVKRLKRIYAPVALFLTIFFTLYFAGAFPVHFSVDKIVGSYLLLNDPSIGYVWIMRVFLLVAIMLPAADKVVRRTGTWSFVLLLGGCTFSQQGVIYVSMLVHPEWLRLFVFDTVVYAWGYLPLVLMGLKVRNLSRRALWYIAVGSAIVVALSVVHYGIFRPILFKYPPRLQYIVYGLLAGVVLWQLRPWLQGLARWRGFGYLSVNSMWLYLWHIVPVYLLEPWMDMQGLWFGRCVVVIIAAVVLNEVYTLIKRKFRKV